MSSHTPPSVKYRVFAARTARNLPSMRVRNAVSSRSRISIRDPSSSVALSRIRSAFRCAAASAARSAAARPTAMEGALRSGAPFPIALMMLRCQSMPSFCCACTAGAEQSAAQRARRGAIPLTSARPSS